MMAIHNEVLPNDDVLRYYFYFINERMKIFWRRCEGKATLTDDPILRKYKFTNVYRALDRVSQYLIRYVIYKDIHLYSPRDVLLRILVFKIFNRIDTWEYLTEFYGDIKESHFDVKQISVLLSERQSYAPIFNNAYMMTGSHTKYNYLPTKHEKWLTMVKQEFLGDNVVDEVLTATSLEGVYNSLRKCSFMGDFLAYQYTIDFNYSPYVNFSEDSFVKAGIGAIRGIKKCFISYGNEYEDAIKYVHYHFTELLEKYQVNDFKPLPGRAPSLLDLQNCFCETDKYLREAMPELIVDNTRIKQRYKPSYGSINVTLPEKWHIYLNKGLCIHSNSKELTLF